MAEAYNAVHDVVRRASPYLVDIAVGLAIAGLIAAMLLMAGKPTQFVYIDF